MTDVTVDGTETDIDVTVDGTGTDIDVTGMANTHVNEEVLDEHDVVGIANDVGEAVLEDPEVTEESIGKHNIL